ncbi:DNA cytosine methyltransferase [Winogradskyella aurantia]|uniref:DNA (cytosine-5-)-methyltransferase n=1 Tax=Winogradskyella aurantia TaxID=1915063 RepID=A0A265UWQ2_9FLAO|nr:DNA cytosine methyltransferase [Winogradskyella aurantia]OZV69731.1 DNA (cytosine-5-)-methyltransferase [Winogradskyella aurantia]
MQNRTIKAVDFFCSGGGMSFGMQQAGIKVIAGIDFDESCKETYESNIKDAKFIHADVFELKEKELEKNLSLKKNDDKLVLIGCSPCQFWSIINTDKTKSAKSKNLLVEFSRFVKYFRPGYVVVENVPGVLRKKEESGLNEFIEWLKTNGYSNPHFKVHNVNNFGVPQNRKRFTLIATRLSKQEIQPIEIEGEKLTVKDVLGEENGFPKIEAGHKDLTTFYHSVPNISDTNKKRLKKVAKNGGNRFGFSNDPELQLDCFVGRDDSFKDTFGRLWWNKPSPTITTKFFSISNGRFVHPEEDRALSIREGATLQSFPKDYIFKTMSIAKTARMIGNAVPPKYAEAIGRAIINANA